MFFKKNQPRTPIVRGRKASDIIASAGSHKQKKYLSLMLVPSYTTGKTRTLRIPRAVFYCVLLALFAVSAVIAGLQIRGNYLRHRAEEYRTAFIMTTEDFENFINQSVDEINEWRANNQDLYSQLTTEQRDRINEQIGLRRDHQGALNYLEERIADKDRQIQDMYDMLTAAIEGLAARAFIPPVAPLVEQMKASQAELREEMAQNGNGEYYYSNGYEYTNGITAPISAVLAGDFALMTAGTLPLPAIVTEESLLAQIEEGERILENLRILIEDFTAHRELIEPHSLNHPTLWPVDDVISSPFGSRRNPFNMSVWQWHNGVDIAAGIGTPIHAAGGGVVTFSGWMAGGAGIVVIIDHGNGIETLYAHNRSNTVQVGDRVERGQVIAYIGMTGSTTGPHVHYEVRVNGRNVNPRDFLLQRTLRG